MSAMPKFALPAVDERALVQKHAELVRRIAHHLAARLPASVEIDDLIQAGMIGLLDAARHYDGSAGASFETYAGIRIRGAMVDELRSGDWAPRSVHRKVREASEAMRALEQKFGRAAREVDIAETLGVSLEDYRQTMADAVQCQMLSLDAPRDGDDDEAWQVEDHNSPSPAEQLQGREFKKALTEAIGKLPEKEQLVLSLYYRDELNLREIGEVLSITESRVCQIHGQALVRLRGHLADWLSPPARRKPAVRLAKTSPKAAGSSGPAAFPDPQTHPV
ncbi:RNA polymerase sigma factor FliA [Stagnimonas aquatica]|uniref:RNA polymerase sigma factor FliA n=1 Tax=Stagnimonas aquatica TaxID=2689987 RepID=A0A3N0VDD4_9GAMM|nr:RNA polymerase sigma factor FliA [Stagnimonas aquatica]ROH90797.1 RNA polymerase sigma factor FliA [Stagnimonas aquatica]